MKTIKITLCAAVLGLMSFTVLPAKSVAKIIETAASAVTWKSESIDLGEIPQNKPKAIEFEFKNTGKTAVVISEVKASCGCTATDYTKTPVKPGETAKVTATYNAANKGAFTKTVTVTTNAETAPKVLSFKGTVI
ncbi:DUF1573 domain-containing protein [Flavobacterium noncentrifugens]|uniref:DUF1573 domain-containing protein n=1 Tax=Flavobacterium noncentrifugens TaxID=1128970 RepID=A0A1G8VNE9_9FLAO|nr:DUF1573 domain-containing protein [Flavobacterium noncentrifugens]SDJ67591.1 Protein of unknown function [Flavobacterium noncentrifugens]